MIKMKNIVIDQYKAGVSISEIAKTLGITTRYVYKIISKECSSSSSSLTESSYIEAIKYGFKSKTELADHFKVSRMKLQRFETKTGIIQKIARYLHIQGKTEKEITSILKTKSPRLLINEAGTLPTIAGIKSDLKTVLEVLKEYAKIDDDAQSQFYKIKRIYEKL